MTSLILMITITMEITDLPFIEFELLRCFSELF